MKQLSLIVEIGFMGKRRRAETSHEAIADHFKMEDDVPEKTALDNYQSYSKSVNNYHWSKHKNTPYVDSVMTEHDAKKNSEGLDKFINMKKTPSKLVVYSGTKHDPQTMKNSEGIVHHPAYLSTSLDQNVAESFARKNITGYRDMHMLKIHVPKGHPATYVPSSLNNPFSRKEEELVLPRGLNLKHIKTDIESTDGGKMLHTHTMKIVP
jgi:hypothetical protein